MESSRTLLRSLIIQFFVLGAFSWLYLDIPLRTYINEHPVPLLRTTTWLLGRPGQTTFWIVGGILITALARWRPRYCPVIFRESAVRNRFFLHLGIAFIVSGITVTAMKYAVGRPRPSEFLRSGAVLFHHFSTSPRYASFPSGHSQTVWGGVATCLIFFPRYRAILLVVGILGCIGRIVMLRHYPSDVFAGAIVGIAGAIIAQRIVAGAWCARLISGWCRNTESGQ